MAIEVPPDVDTTHPVMDITGPGVVGKLLEATGAHTAAWTGSGGGGGGTINGKYVAEGELKEKVARKVEGLTCVLLRVTVKNNEGNLHLEVGPEGSRRRIWEANIGAEGVGITGEEVPITFFVPAGEEWLWQGSNIGNAEGKLNFQEFELEIV